MLDIHEKIYFEFIKHSFKKMVLKPYQQFIKTADFNMLKLF